MRGNKVLFKSKLKSTLLIVLLIVTIVFGLTKIWITSTQKELKIMYPLEKSKNIDASSQFLKAMEYRIYIKELHRFFDYDSIVIRFLINRMNDHFNKGRTLLPKESVEDIVWWVVFYKDIYGLVVPPRNDNSLAFENLEPKAFSIEHEKVFRMIERYPYGEINFDLDEINKYKFQTMAILVEFYFGEFVQKYDVEGQKNKAILYSKDQESITKLKQVLFYYSLIEKKYLPTSQYYEKMKLHYDADQVAISSEILLKAIYNDPNHKLPMGMCNSKEAYLIRDKGLRLLKSLDVKNHQTEIIYTDIFNQEHSNKPVLFYTLAIQCANLNPTMEDISKKVKSLNLRASQ